MQIRRDGAATVAETKVHIQVKLGFVTLYRYDQTQTEHWADGHFVSLSAKTDDNGTSHEVNAKAGHDAVRVDADGETKQLAPTIIPDGLWNPTIVAQSALLDPQDGSILKVHSVDRGEEQLRLAGQSVKAHHYSIEGTHPEGHLVMIPTTISSGWSCVAATGSRIEYRRN